ncbi:MAG: alpha-2-macroglobulin domain protein 2 [Ramlibacter sp.]|nr:alpha-2-macroglobulin domain protein 2 [Ramlibacter sp.]
MSTPRKRASCTVGLVAAQRRPADWPPHRCTKGKTGAGSARGVHLLHGRGAGLAGHRVSERLPGVRDWCANYPFSCLEPTPARHRPGRREDVAGGAGAAAHHLDGDGLASYLAITIAPSQWPTHAVIDWLNILRRVTDLGRAVPALHRGHVRHPRPTPPTILCGDFTWRRASPRTPPSPSRPPPAGCGTPGGCCTARRRSRPPFACTGGAAGPSRWPATRVRQRPLEGQGAPAGDRRRDAGVGSPAGAGRVGLESADSCCLWATIRARVKELQGSASQTLTLRQASAGAGSGLRPQACPQCCPRILWGAARRPCASAKGLRRPGPAGRPPALRAAATPAPAPTTRAGRRRPARRSTARR